MVEAKLPTEAQGVPGDRPTEVVDDLKGLVAIHVGAFSRVAEAGERRDSDGRNAPGDLRRRVDTRDVQLAHYISFERELRADAVEEAVVAEPELIDHVGRENPCVGHHDLLRRGQELGPVQVEGGCELSVIGPGEPERPAGVRAFDEIEPSGELIAVQHAVLCHLVVGRQAIADVGLGIELEKLE